MSEIGDGFSRFDNIRRNAYWALTELDSRLPLDSSTIEDYSRHIKDKINHPTTGMLAMREMERKPLNYPLSYRSNLDMFEKRIAETSELTQEFNELMDKLYPKTRKLREYIIKHDRVKLNFIKPKSGNKIFKKLVSLMLRR